METKDIKNAGVDALFERISSLIEESRKKVATAVNIAEVYTKYEIGRYIVEDEQEGKARAAYGKQVLDVLAQRLTQKFDTGWTVDTLKRCRKFYQVYSTSQIGATLLPQSETNVAPANLSARQKELQAKLKSWIEEFEEQEEKNSLK